MLKMSSWSYKDVLSDVTRLMILSLILSVVVLTSNLLTYFLKISYLIGQILVDNFLIVCRFLTETLLAISLAFQIIYEDALIFLADVSDKITVFASLIYDFYLVLQNGLTWIVKCGQSILAVLQAVTNFAEAQVTDIYGGIITIKRLLQNLGLNIWTVMVAVPVIILNSISAVINFNVDFIHFLIALHFEFLNFTFHLIDEFYTFFWNIEYESLIGILICVLLGVLVCRKLKILCSIIQYVYNYCRSVAISLYTQPFQIMHRSQNLKSFRYSNAEDDERLCVICQFNPKEMIIFPCKHLCLCWECSNILAARQPICPLCRANINELLKVYW